MTLNVSGDRLPIKQWRKREYVLELPGGVLREVPEMSVRLGAREVDTPGLDEVGRQVRAALIEMPEEQHAEFLQIFGDLLGEKIGLRVVVEKGEGWS